LWTVDETFDVVTAARDVAGILLDNWLKGRRRAVWISKSDKLIEDAARPTAGLP
jgi:hypothetical protein